MLFHPSHVRAKSLHFLPAETGICGSTAFITDFTEFFATHCHPETLSYTTDFTHRIPFSSGNASPHIQSYVHTFTFAKTDIRVARGTTITNTVIGN